MYPAFLIQLAVLSFFVWRLSRSSEVSWLTGETLKRNKLADAEAKRIRDGIQSEELAAITQTFDMTALDSKSVFDVTKDRLLRAIDYAIRRHDWYEDQRSKVFQQAMTISFAILTVSLAVAGLIIQKEIKAPEVFPCLGGFIAIACICIPRSAVLYNAELNADRPYRLISDIRFWYFRYNLPDTSKNGKEDKGPIQRAEDVAAERRNFLSRLSQSFSPDQAMREDIEQLYILQVLQRSKQESLTRLQWLLSDLALVTSIEVAIAFLTLAVKFLWPI